jgi:signal transduction histidine kinase
VLIRRALKELVDEIAVVTELGAAREVLARETFELVVSDVNLPDSSSVGVVGKLLEVIPETPIIVLTSSASLSDAVEAMKLGARDFIVKNFDEGFREVFALSLSRVAAAVESEREKLRLQRETEVLREVIENSPDGLAVLDQHGRARYSNSSYQRFLALLELTPDQPLAFSPDRVGGAEELNSFLRQTLTTIEEGAVFSRELEVKSSTAEAFEISLSGVPERTLAVKEHEETLQREYIVFLRDVSTLRKREKFQREILSTTTHDLRGPLGAILTASELLLDMLPANQKPHELVLRSRSAAQGMLNLINEFLSARRIEEGNFILKPQQFPVAALIEEIDSNYGTIAQARGVTLALDGLHTSKEMFADKLGVARALGNIVGNALKFTARGGSVHVFFREEIDHLVLGVTDTGDGMNASELRQLFEKFSRLDKHRHVAGTGLGLFVVRSVAAAHGGSVRVQSQVGKGSTFEIVLPRNVPVNERGELVLLDFA